MKTIASPNQKSTNLPAIVAERKISQNEAVSRTGLGKGTVMRLMAGDMTVQLVVFVYFCECLDIDLCEALKGTELE